MRTELGRLPVSDPTLHNMAQAALSWLYHRNGATVTEKSVQIYSVLH